MSFDYRDYLHPRHWPTWVGIGILRAFGLMPFALQSWLGGALGWASYYLAGERRRVARINLQLCFPELSDTARERLIKDNFIASGRGFTELGSFWWMSGEEYRRRSRVFGLEHLDRALDEGNVLLLGVHFTCLESGVRALKERGYHMQGMYKPAHDKLFDAFMRAQRDRHYAGGMIPNRETKRFLQRLRKGQLSWYAPDQSFSRSVVFAPLFGIETASLTATAKLAQVGRAQVLPFFGIRNPAGNGFDAYVLPPLKDFPSGDDVADATRVNRAIEEMIRYAPEQYMWGHRRFKRLANGRPNPYNSDQV
ncbi:MAG: LpxL/LpxP family Kdo(2)-lipid IV(A) lauroyl/palmitoleoyl acyltransferase [Pseudomonadota bacterium]